MSDPYMGQIIFAAFNYAPRQYANCDGATLPVTQYGALFALLGKAFGGDGATTFALPDLRGRVPIGTTSSADPKWQPTPILTGQVQGTETVALGNVQMPPHTHAINVSSTVGTSGNPNRRTFATAGGSMYGQPVQGQMVALGGSPMSSVGSGMPHENMQPFTVIEAAIALAGIYPPRS